MIVNLKSFVNLPAKVILLRRSDFAAFYQVVIENIYSHLLSNIKWSAPLNSETKLSYSVRYILNEELKGV